MPTRRQLCQGFLASALTLGVSPAIACISLPIYRRAHVRADVQGIEHATQPLILTSIDLLSILLPFGAMEDWSVPELGSKNDDSIAVRIDADTLMEAAADSSAVTVVTTLEEAIRTNAAPALRFISLPLASGRSGHPPEPAYSIGLAESKVITTIQPVIHFGMLGTGKHTIAIRHRKKKLSYRLELLVVDYREAMKDAPWQRVKTDRAPLPSGHIPKC